MDKISIITQLYDAALEHGFVDLFRKSAPDQTNTGYIVWLVQTGSFKVIVFSESFMNAIALYFASKNVSDPIASDGAQLLPATAAATDPINYLGAFLSEALLSGADFSKLIDDTKADLEAKAGQTITLELSDDKHTATLTLGSYKNSVSVKGDTTLETYQQINMGLKDLSDQLLTALTRKGAEAFIS